jgi:hypothetical protein
MTTHQITTQHLCWITGLKTIFEEVCGLINHWMLISLKTVVYCWKTSCENARTEWFMQPTSNAKFGEYGPLSQFITFKTSANHLQKKIIRIIRSKGYATMH